MDDAITPELREAILDLAARPAIRSISCALVDFQLWQGLLIEQASRSERLGVPPQEALCLAGPDSGIPGVTPVRCGWEDDDDWPQVLPDQQGNLAPNCWGGEVHIQYEGVCGGDLLIPPKWLALSPQALARPDARFQWISTKRCNLLLLNRDFGELPHAKRSELVSGWWLYQSTSPFLDCNPFYDGAHE